jgi:hypothetical protein
MHIQHQKQLPGFENSLLDVSIYIVAVPKEEFILHSMRNLKLHFLKHLLFKSIWFKNLHTSLTLNSAIHPILIEVLVHLEPSACQN